MTESTGSKTSERRFQDEVTGVLVAVGRQDTPAHGQARPFDLGSGFPIIQTLSGQFALSDENMEMTSYWEKCLHD